MKKQKVKSLFLSKKVISKLDNLQTVVGGKTGNESNNEDPTYYGPTGISTCIICIGEPSEVCAPGGGTAVCLLTTGCAPSAFC